MDIKMATKTQPARRIPTLLPPDNPYTLLRAQVPSIPRFVKLRPTSSSKWTRSKYFNEIERRVRQYHPSIPDSDLIKVTNELTPLYERKGLVSKEEVDETVKQVQAKKHLENLPDVVESKLTNIYNTLSGEERLKIIQSSSPSELLKIEGVPDDELREALVKLIKLGPNFKISPPIEGAPGLPMIEPSPVQDEPLSDSDTDQLEKAFKRFKGIADTYLKEARDIYGKLPLDQRFEVLQQLREGVMPDALVQGWEESESDNIEDYFDPVKTVRLISKKGEVDYDDPIYVKMLKQRFDDFVRPDEARVSKMARDYEAVGSGALSNKRSKKKVIYYH